MRRTLTLILIAGTLFMVGCSKDPETEKQELLDMAKKMSKLDYDLTQNAIHMVEGGLHKKSGWSQIDSQMSQVSPETRVEYYQWKQAVIDSYE